jgi:arylsulfatase A-like enzyme
MGMPNILLITSDQQRWDSLGCYGADWVETPALDSIASAGARFDRCYCTNPICTPSRASMWTGRHLPGHGVYRLDDILPEDQVMFGEYLQQAGYRTGLFGKLHVSGRRYEDEQRHPHDGFHEYEWALEGPLNMDAPMQSYARWLKEQDPAVYAKMHELGRDLLHIPRHLHFTHWAAERSRDFIRRNAEGPFFCCMSVFDPHNPYEDYPTEYRQRVAADLLPRVIDDRRDDVPLGVERERQGSYLGDINTFTDEDVREMRIGYYASIALLDDEVGEVLSLLDELGIADNTLVIFASDHGDMLGDHRMLVKGAMFYDPSVRIPFLMRWPGRIPPGTVVRSPVQLYDIAATVLAAAGVTPPWNPGELDCTGRDLLPLLRGEIDRVHDEAVCLYRNTGLNRVTRDWDPPIHASMMFDGRYKLSLFHTDTGTPGRTDGELYDMENDPEELTNLWDEPGAATVRARLTERMLGWIARNETVYLGSRGGTAVVPPEQYVANTIDRHRGERHGKK